MLEIRVPEVEIYNEDTREFKTLPSKTFKFEHSLKAIAKWEFKYELPFLDTKKDSAQTLYYYKCMCTDSGFRYEYLTAEVIEQLNDYLNKTHTATIAQRSTTDSGSKSVITSEWMYALMIMNHVPQEFDKWEFHRLLKLMDCIAIMNGSEKNKPKKSERELLDEMSRRNIERLNAMNSQNG